MKGVSKAERIARRVAREFRDGDCVNLGRGIPARSASFVPEGVSITLHSESGMLGMGPPAREGEEDADLVGAGGETVTETPGCAYLASDLTFAIVRGGHLDVTVLEALEVDERGDLATWTIPGTVVKGMGGAMDLAAGARRVIVATTHTSDDGSPKILEKCTLPLTGKACVDRIVTEMAVIDVTPSGLSLVEVCPDYDVPDVVAATGAKLAVGDVQEMMI